MQFFRTDLLRMMLVTFEGNLSLFRAVVGLGFFDKITEINWLRNLDATRTVILPELPLGCDSDYLLHCFWATNMKALELWISGGCVMPVQMSSLLCSSYPQVH